MLPGPLGLHNAFSRVNARRVSHCSLALLLLTLGAHAQRGLRYLVCPSVCLTDPLELQATKRYAYGTLVFSATTARKIMWPIWLKRPSSGKRNRHRPGSSFVTQPINYRGAHAYLLHARLALSRQSSTARSPALL